MNPASDATAPATRPLDPYLALDEAELTRRVQAARQAMGPRLLTLGHHYQRDAVVELSDLQGDSYRLSELAAGNETCEAIVFCGVHFMAETADVLANRPEKLAARDGRRVNVILPDLDAGCPMADMARIDQVEQCWDELSEVIDTDDVTPVTYINSAASLKAFCGRHGGIVCTSSNAEAVLRWALARRSRVLFFPDQHLGRNTALAMGMPIEEMPVWDPHQRPLGGNTADAIRRGRVLLWQGYCSVHQVFLPYHVEQFRRDHAGIRIMVHPECMREVVEQADVVGSTGRIVREVESAPPGTKWAIGTELNLVRRLARNHPNQEIHFLAPVICMCATMYRIDLPHLCWAVENLAAGAPVNVIRVAEPVARDALAALVRMLEIRGA